MDIALCIKEKWGKKMDRNSLKRANELITRISDLNSFICSVKNNRTLRIFNKTSKKTKQLTLCATDYMRPFSYHEVSHETKERILCILEEERDKLQEELDNL